MNFQEGQLRNKDGPKAQSYSPVTPSPYGSGRPLRKLGRQLPTLPTATRAYHEGPSTRRTRRGFRTSGSRSSSARDGALIAEVTDMDHALGHAWSSAELICADPITDFRS
ncbi:hypothetical protein ACVI1J_001573 [Bradyrhizobium diazoefficiens]